MTETTGAQSATQPLAAAALLGHRIAFTGRFATLSRHQAEALVIRAQGLVCSGVTVRTTLLVVGMRGWPLLQSGRITRSLAEAERLRATGRSIRIISETRFREIVGLETAAGGADKPLTTLQVCEALGVEPRTLERWEHFGLVRPHDGTYDFQDLVSLRTVTGLVSRGISPVVIRQSLDALADLLPGVDRPLSQLNILVSHSGELVAELEEALLTQSGQMEMRFGMPARTEQSARPVTIPSDAGRDAATLIKAGLGFEESGDLDRAEEAYRQAAAHAPADPVPHFNLGNVLLAARRLTAAAERFAHAAALDPSHAAAWFNLAHVQDERGELDAAVRSLRRAIAADPAYADAYYNLAELSERKGDFEAAADAWDRYLRLDPRSEWGSTARRRLRALRGPAWA